MHFRVKHRFLESSISLQQDQILLGTQAFASPPDMASSGVWEMLYFQRHPQLMVSVECYTL